MSIKIDDNNYEDYKKVLTIAWRHLSKNSNSKLSNQALTLENLTQLESTHPKSIVKRVIREWLVILVEWTKDSHELIKEIDLDLTANGLTTIKTLKTIIQGIERKVIKNQKIKNFNEYSIIKELLDDTSSNVNAEDRSLLNKLISEFESTQRPANSTYPKGGLSSSHEY